MPTLPVQQRPPNMEEEEEDDDEPMQMDIAENDDQEELPVLDEVQLDLESYVVPYVGLTRVQRLEYIADHCNSLRPLALDMALRYIKETSHNIKDYVRLFQKLETATMFLPSEAKFGLRELKSDTAWIDVKKKQTALRYNKLEAELKNFRACFIKETLRRAQDELGNHYLDCGCLDKALTAYTKALEYTTSNKNQVHQYLSIIRVSILLRRWACVSNYVVRAEAEHSLESQNQYIDKQLQCAAGLCELNHRRYKASARHLLSTNFDHFEHIESNILAPVNVLIYGSLCALATYSRAELASQLVNSASFRQFSELDAQIRDVVNCFYESKYGLCLDILRDMKDILLLDMYLAPHVEALFVAIRNRALVQYFEPYSSACLRKMAASFTNVTLEELEKEIVNLICDGHIRARIDSHHKILYASKVDSRCQIFESAIGLGKLWQRQAHALISRTAILNAGLRVGKRITFAESN